MSRHSDRSKTGAFLRRKFASLPPDHPSRVICGGAGRGLDSLHYWEEAVVYDHLTRKRKGFFYVCMDDEHLYLVPSKGGRVREGSDSQLLGVHWYNVLVVEPDNDNVPVLFDDEIQRDVRGVRLLIQIDLQDANTNTHPATTIGKSVGPNESQGHDTGRPRSPSVGATSPTVTSPRRRMSDSMTGTPVGTPLLTKRRSSESRRAKLVTSPLDVGAEAGNADPTRASDPAFQASLRDGTGRTFSEERTLLVDKLGFSVAEHGRRRGLAEKVRALYVGMAGARVTAPKNPLLQQSSMSISERMDRHNAMLRRRIARGARIHQISSQLNMRMRAFNQQQSATLTRAHSDGTQPARDGNVDIIARAVSDPMGTLPRPVPSHLEEHKSPSSPTALDLGKSPLPEVLKTRSRGHQRSVSALPSPFTSPSMRRARSQSVSSIPDQNATDKEGKFNMVGISTHHVRTGLVSISIYTYEQNSALASFLQQAWMFANTRRQLLPLYYPFAYASTSALNPCPEAISLKSGLKPLLVLPRAQSSGAEALSPSTLPVRRSSEVLVARQEQPQPNFRQLQRLIEHIKGAISSLYAPQLPHAARISTVLSLILQYSATGGQQFGSVLTQYDIIRLTQSLEQPSTRVRGASVFKFDQRSFLESSKHSRSGNGKTTQSTRRFSRMSTLSPARSPLSAQHRKRSTSMQSPVADRSQPESTRNSASSSSLFSPAATPAGRAAQSQFQSLVSMTQMLLLPDGLVRQMMSRGWEWKPPSFLITGNDRLHWQQTTATKHCRSFLQYVQTHADLLEALPDSSWVGRISHALSRQSGKERGPEFLRECLGHLLQRWCRWFESLEVSVLITPCTDRTQQMQLYPWRPMDSVLHPCVRGPLSSYGGLLSRPPHFSPFLSAPSRSIRRSAFWKLLSDPPLTALVAASRVQIGELYTRIGALEEAISSCGVYYAVVRERFVHNSTAEWWKCLLRRLWRFAHGYKDGIPHIPRSGDFIKRFGGNANNEPGDWRTDLSSFVPLYPLLNVPCGNKTILRDTLIALFSNVTTSSDYHIRLYVERVRDSSMFNRRDRNNRPNARMSGGAFEHSSPVSHVLCAEWVHFLHRTWCQITEVVEILTLIHTILTGSEMLRPDNHSYTTRSPDQKHASFMGSPDQTGTQGNAHFSDGSRLLERLVEWMREVGKEESLHSSVRQSTEHLPLARRIRLLTSSLFNRYKDVSTLQFGDLVRLLLGYPVGFAANNLFAHSRTATSMAQESDVQDAGLYGRFGIDQTAQREKRTRAENTRMCETFMRNVRRCFLKTSRRLSAECEQGLDAAPAAPTEGMSRERTVSRGNTSLSEFVSIGGHDRSFSKASIDSATLTIGPRSNSPGESATPTDYSSSRVYGWGHSICTTDQPDWKEEDEYARESESAESAVDSTSPSATSTGSRFQSLSVDPSAGPVFPPGTPSHQGNATGDILKPLWIAPRDEKALYWWECRYLTMIDLAMLRLHCWHSAVFNQVIRIAAFNPSVQSEDATAATGLSSMHVGSNTASPSVSMEASPRIPRRGMHRSALTMDLSAMMTTAFLKQDRSTLCEYILQPEGSQSEGPLAEALTESGVAPISQHTLNLMTSQTGGSRLSVWMGVVVALLTERAVQHTVLTEDLGVTVVRDRFVEKENVHQQQQDCCKVLDQRLLHISPYVRGTAPRIVSYFVYTLAHSLLAVLQAVPSIPPQSRRGPRFTAFWGVDPTAWDSFPGVLRLGLSMAKAGGAHALLGGAESLEEPAESLNASPASPRGGGHRRVRSAVINTKKLGEWIQEKELRSSEAKHTFKRSRARNRTLQVLTPDLSLLDASANGRARKGRHRRTRNSSQLSLSSITSAKSRVSERKSQYQPEPFIVTTKHVDDGSLAINDVTSRSLQWFPQNYFEKIHYFGWFPSVFGSELDMIPWEDLEWVFKGDEDVEEGGAAAATAFTSVGGGSEGLQIIVNHAQEKGSADAQARTASPPVNNPCCVRNRAKMLKRRLDRIRSLSFLAEEEACYVFDSRSLGMLKRIADLLARIRV